MEPLRIALAGTGSIAARGLAPALRATPHACLWSVLSRDRVRGTEFDVHVARPSEPNPGATWIMLYGGAVQFCTFDKVCEVIDDFCEIGHMTTADSEIIGDARETKGELRQQLKGDFPYAMSQNSLLREFWFRQARDCLNKDPNSAPDPLFPDDTKPGPVDPNRVLVAPIGDDVHQRLKGKIGWRKCEAVMSTATAEDEGFEEPLRVYG